MGDGHVLHWESFGPAAGIPALVLHGGPGSGFSPALRALCERAGPEYRWIAFDQRGCGRSAPHGCIEGNDTERLISDIDTLRRHLSLEHWLVVGGSWGATLALVYATRHAQAVTGLLARSLFVPSAEELDWFFGGAAHLQPEAWRAFSGLAPPACAKAMLPWLTEVFAGADEALQRRVTSAWVTWERALIGGAPGEPPQGEELRAALARCRIQAHYLRHRCWIPDDWLERAAGALQRVPVLFLHGEQDVVCRPEAALAAQRKLAGSRIWHVPGAGHDPFHCTMQVSLREALRRFAAGELSA